MYSHADKAKCEKYSKLKSCLRDMEAKNKRLKEKKERVNRENQLIGEALDSEVRTKKELENNMQIKIKQVTEENRKWLGKNKKLNGEKNRLLKENNELFRGKAKLCHERTRLKRENKKLVQENKKLGLETKSKSEDSMCKICFSNQINIAIARCGHTLCEDCVDRLRNCVNCPFCRRKIKFAIRIYL